MSALEALAKAKAAGVVLILDGDGIIAAPTPTADVIAQLRAVKPDLMRILTARDAAKATLAAERPAGARVNEWAEAMRGLQRFVARGWGDRAALMGWTGDELYRLPVPWCHVDRAGAALFVGDRQVIAVTDLSIVIKVPSGSTLRIGRQHLNSLPRKAFGRSQ
jgi:hypothetical protein